MSALPNPKHEMSEEQKKLFDALTPLQQKVSINILSGMSNIDSFLSANKKVKNKAVAEANVSRMVSHAKVKAFLDSIKGSAVSDAIMSRERMLELQTKIADIGNAELQLMGLESLNELKGALDIKLKAMKQIADLSGYEAPKQIEVSAKEELTPWGAINASVDE